MRAGESEVLVDMLLSANARTVTTPAGGRLVRLDSTTNEYDEVVERVETFGPVEPFVLEEMEAREFQVKQHPFVYAIKWRQFSDDSYRHRKFVIWTHSIAAAEAAWEMLVEDGDSELWPDWINQPGRFWDGTETADGLTYLLVYDTDADWEDEEGELAAIDTQYVKAVESEEAAHAWFGDWAEFSSAGMIVLDEDGERVEDEAEDNPAPAKARLLRY